MPWSTVDSRFGCGRRYPQMPQKLSWKLGDPPLTANGPAWLRIDGEGARRRWKPRSAETAIVQDIFALAATGKTPEAIRKSLEERGVSVFKSADEWSTPLIVALLKNDAVVGHFWQRGELAPIEGYYPAIIPSEVFARVQTLIQSRKLTSGQRDGAIENLFSGLLSCECGDRMRLQTLRSGAKIIRCRKTGCGLVQYKYEPFELAFMWGLQNHIQYEPLSIDGAIVLQAARDEAAAALLAVQKVQLEQSESSAIRDSVNRARAHLLEAERALQDDSRRPEAEALVDLWGEHERLQADNAPGLPELRSRIQGAIRELVSEIVMEQAPRAQLGLRACVYYGPIAHLARQNRRPDGGCALAYAEDWIETLL